MQSIGLRALTSPTSNETSSIAQVLKTITLMKVALQMGRFAVGRSHAIAKNERGLAWIARALSLANEAAQSLRALPTS
jgi:hypothetical protein